MNETDIVVRLRASHEHLNMITGGRTPSSIYSEAADEIERLRRQRSS